MSEGKEEAPIIVKKGKKCKKVGGGAWEIAYGDFVTSMMALFIVLWVLGQSEEIKKAVGGYFRDPVGFTAGGGTKVQIIKGNPSKTIAPDIMNAIEKKQKEKIAFDKVGKQILDKIKENPKFKKMIGKQIKVEAVNEGLKIELLESRTEPFFSQSSANLNTSSEKLVETIGKQLSELNNKIVIEGFTDANKYAGSKTGYSNFELSADRANSARRALIKGGLREEQISGIRGHGANKLADPAHPFAAVNRRISIIVKYSDAKDE